MTQPNFTLLEIDEDGRAISWEGDLNAMMREAFHIIAERINAAGSPEESMKLLIKHLHADASYNYAFTIDETPLHGHKFKFEDLNKIAGRSD